MNDDLISRQAAIDYLLDDLYDLEDTDCVDKEFIEEGLKRVPSVQPKQKTGQLISNRYTDTVLCSECKKCYGDESKFCPNCGANMKRESEDYKNNE